MSHGTISQLAMDSVRRRCMRRSAWCRSLSAWVEETARDIIGHDCDPIDNIPRRNYIARQYLWPHQLSGKQTAVFVPAVFSRALFVANFIHRDEGIAARFPFGAVRPFGLRAGAAKA